VYKPPIQEAGRLPPSLTYVVPWRPNGPRWSTSREQGAAWGNGPPEEAEEGHGITSATRDILTVGAELSLVGGQGPTARTMTELGVNAAVVVALSVALVLIRRFARLDRA
jgi:hypothetical protein